MTLQVIFFLKASFLSFRAFLYQHQVIYDLLVLTVRSPGCSFGFSTISRVLDTLKLEKWLLVLYQVNCLKMEFSELHQLRNDRIRVVATSTLVSKPSRRVGPLGVLAFEIRPKIEFGQHSWKKCSDENYVSERG